MKEYETWEALKILSKNKKYRFLSAFNNELGSLEMKFESGILKIRNKNGAVIELSISIFEIYKWVIGS